MSGPRPQQPRPRPRPRRPRSRSRQPTPTTRPRQPDPDPDNPPPALHRRRSESELGVGRRKSDLGLGPRTRTSDSDLGLGPRTSDLGLGPRTSDLGPRTSDSDLGRGPRTSDLGPRTSDSDLGPRTSDLGPRTRTSDLGLGPRTRTRTRTSDSDSTSALREARFVERRLRKAPICNQSIKIRYEQKTQCVNCLLSRMTRSRLSAVNLAKLLRRELLLVELSPTRTQDERKPLSTVFRESAERRSEGMRPVRHVCVSGSFPRRSPPMAWRLSGPRLSPSMRAALRRRPIAVRADLVSTPRFEARGR
jgi:hypothetical protein